MNIKRLTGPIAALSAGVMLAACGGGSSNGGGPDNNPPPPAPAPTSVTAIGSITGFGSVWVNGSRWEVESDTVIAIEDEAETMGDDSMLRLGMKVYVTGTDSNGARSADRIEFDEDLKGPIEAITPDPTDPTIGTIQVVSTPVTINSRTVFDDDVGDNDGIPGIDMRDLQLAMVVEISGIPIDGGYLATRVDRVLDALGGNPVVGDPGVDGDELELKGVIDSIAGDGMSFTVNDVLFMVGAGMIIEDGLALNDLLGMFVEVKADIVGGENHAIRIELEDLFRGGDLRGELEIEAVVQNVDTSSNPHTVTIGGLVIAVTDASSLVALQGMRVEIRGTINDDGVLVLSEAQPDVEDNVRTEDLVADVGATSFTTRLGLVISPDGGSGVQDDTSDDGDHLTPQDFLGRLGIGDRIEARGHGDPVIWTRIERRELAANNDDLECRLRGPVEQVTGDASSFSFHVQGIEVLTDDVTDNNFEDANDQPMQKAAFFDAIVGTGVVVEAQSFELDGSCIAGTLNAREVGLEPVDGP